MKKTTIFLISAYQKIVGTLLKNVLGTGAFCRFSPTCSDFAKLSIQNEGIVKGGRASLIRILSCHPFAKE
jgi:putative membrane protein insertion efficiency factor